MGKRLKDFKFNNFKFQEGKMKIVTFGEIMLRLSPPGFLRFHQATELEASFGGGEANVAVSLANYGLDVDFVTRMPRNDISDAAIKTLKKYDVCTDKIIFGGDRLGIYFLETGAVSRASKVIYDRSHSAIAEISPEMIDAGKILADADWFHWTGITPAISQGAADTLKELLKKAEEKNITVSVDLNYRKKLWKYGKSAQEIMPELVGFCDIVLGNEEDAEKSLGISPQGVDVTSGEVSAEAYESVSKQIMEKYPRVKKVITTLRGSISASHNTWGGVLFDYLENTSLATIYLQYPIKLHSRVWMASIFTTTKW
jgi:2-dehydro-3-deoxygluconokinase